MSANFTDETPAEVRSLQTGARVPNAATAAQSERSGMTASNGIKWVAKIGNALPNRSGPAPAENRPYRDS
jgi:hypothetical protein